MKFAKIRKVINPQYAHIGQDAGIDFYIPQFDTKFVQDLFRKNEQSFLLQWEIDKQKKVISIHSNGRILIPSGILVNFQKHRALIANNKSGVTNKKGIITSGVIDHNYQGEVHIQLINTSNKTVQICENQKIIQYILFVIDNNQLEQTSVQELYFSKSKRGQGGFGSTNNR